MQPRERGNKRTNQKERGAAQGEPGTGKMSCKGEANGAKNTATMEAKKNRAKKAKRTVEKVSTDIVIVI